MNNIVKFAFVLMITSGLAIAGVALVYGISKPPIVKKKEQTIKASLALAFNMTDEEFAGCDIKSIPENAESPDCWEVTYRADGRPVGYAAKGVSHKGYGGDVEVIAAFKEDPNDPSKAILIGAAVTDVSKETPGLGQNATQKKPTSTWLQLILGVKEVEPQKGPPLKSYVFMEQFQEKEEAKLVRASNPKDGIVAMAGSTISSLAVIDAVKDALNKVKVRVHKTRPATSASPAH
jgi:Na+-translocating ferredoxin:NAD+ oxidoreductase RnfG subunit